MLPWISLAILDDSNFLRGAFGKGDLKRSTSERDRSARRWALAGIALSLIWIFGLGSLFGIIAGLLGRVDSESAQTRRLADVAIGLGLVGVLAAVLSITLLT